MFDKKVFANILKKICDTYNTQTEFSKVSGVNRTYITMYINCKFDDSPKPKVLEKIAEFSNGITTYEELMIVCGFITKEVIDSYNDLFIKFKKDISKYNFNDYQLEFVNKNISPLYSKDKFKKVEWESLIDGYNFEDSVEIINIIKKFNSSFNSWLDNYNNAYFVNVLESTKIPIIGKISAGLPILAVENIIGYEQAPITKIKKDNTYFYLIVEGDSMNQKFNEGDLILIQKQDTLENDEIGVIMINDEATVKKFKQMNNIVLLSPMSNNPSHTEQMYDINKDKIQIIGKVIAYFGNI